MILFLGKFIFPHEHRRFIEQVVEFERALEFFQRPFYKMVGIEHSFRKFLYEVILFKT